MFLPLTIKNHKLAPLVRDAYTKESFSTICQFLNENGAFTIKSLPSGLFQAAQNDHSDQTGYESVWIRDNIHVAHAQYVCGQADAAVQVVRALANFLQTQRSKMDAIISDPSLADEVMDRPHIRFDGVDMKEKDQQWDHAQNDALGYFIWLFAKLANEQVLKPGADDLALLGHLLRYMDAIKYWQDPDSGHWEEVRKIAGSSIGVVVAALKEMQKPGKSGRPFENTLQEQLEENVFKRLIAQGEQAMKQILPLECTEPELGKYRTVDAALLFLIYPLEVVHAPMADLITHNVWTHLLREHGIKRYPGDSFYCRNFESKMEALDSNPTQDSGLAVHERDALLEPGTEAQWCIFDSILSIIHGKGWLRTGDRNLLELQTYHWNRTLGFLTDEDSPYGGLKCPELYYEENGVWQTSRTTPLAWGQANLRLAAHWMEKSLEAFEGTS